MDIEWKEGAVCFAGSSQWFASCKDNQLTSKCGSYGGSPDECISSYNYQLNTIKQGDYIEASELDKQKYNDAVEVFGLFGFTPYERKAKEALRLVNEIFFASDDLLFIGALEDCEEAKRKITFNQLMAIGELKRLEIELDKAVNVPPNHFIPKAGEYAVSDKELEKSAPKITPDLTPDLVQNPSHYQFFEGVEVIEIIASSMTREQFKGYCLGNRIKYRLRAGNKDKLEQEIAKSDKYVELYDEHKHLCRIDGDLK